MRPRIVGIGASAGGIEAFQEFFQSMPPNPGVGVVVVLHQLANRKSLLAEIVSRWTTMEVSEAVDGALVEPNNVLVVPSGYIATLNQGRLNLRPIEIDSPRPTTVIDDFFDSMATDLGKAAIGVVLSGTGHDGALGLKAIRARGGLTLAQGSDGTAPQYPDMPASAVAAGGVDLLIPVQEMPKAILAARGAAAAQAPADTETNAIRLAICETLRIRLGHDFSQYKHRTFLRRVERRCQVLGVTSLHDYATQLESDHREAVMLFRDLLIGVTTFFRDAAVFDTVKRVVLPRLFQNKGVGDTVRIWVAGCATGEEGYSLAMLVCEYMDGLADRPTVQLFGTDIDDAAIATARGGRYPSTLLEGVSPERRQRFFIRSGNSYQVSKEIREICTFSSHSLVRDPPFSRIDLVSCRNLLIYMDLPLQAAVIPAFHYSLAPGGMLLLGSAETVVRHEELFAPLEKDHRIFLRRDVPSPPIRVFPRTPVAEAPPRHDRKVPPRDGRTNWSRSLAVANSRVLERFASPFVVVTEDGTTVHYSSHVGGMLQPALGAPSRSVFDMARRGLRQALRAVLRAAVESGQPAEQVAQVEAEGGAIEHVTVIAEPLPGYEPDRPYLIVFRNAPARPDPQAAGTAPLDSILASEIDRDLRDTREQLQSLIEEHETALEELRSSNEELHSVNEELQSTNEELETSKEEIQSVNEELQTVNAQLSAKVDELDLANSDLRNLFESTRVATVFLDHHFVIRAFTPEVGGIYNLIPSDRGRPLTDIVSRLDYAHLREDVQGVLQTLEPVERRVSRIDGTAHYLVRILPYRTPDSSVDGSLVTFIDVTQIVEAERRQSLLVEELNHRVENMLALVGSVALRTRERSDSPGQFDAAFSGRLAALTSAYALIARKEWSRIALADIAAAVLPQPGTPEHRAVTVIGPAVSIAPRAALALAMVLRELHANAITHGALSVPRGSVQLGWELTEREGESMLALSWAERDGPAVAVHPRRGFGSMLIEQSLPALFAAKSRIVFATIGVEVTISIPMHKLQEDILLRTIPLLVLPTAS